MEEVDIGGGDASMHTISVYVAFFACYFYGVNTRGCPGPRPRAMVMVVVVIPNDDLNVGE